MLATSEARNFQNEKNAVINLGTHQGEHQRGNLYPDNYVPQAFEEAVGTKAVESNWDKQQGHCTCKQVDSFKKSVTT